MCEQIHHCGGDASQNKESVRTSDLMLGDWVAYNGKPHWVKEFGGSILRVVDPATKEDWIVTNEDLAPVPLTQELLRNNGFANITKRSLVNGSVELTDWNTYWELKVLITMPEADIVCTNVKHLHQLQHLLKFLEIDITFEL